MDAPRWRKLDRTYVDKRTAAVFAVNRMGGPRRRPAVVRNPARSGRTGRCVLAVLLTAASVGWIGEGDSSAAAPAELISVDATFGGTMATQDSLPSVSGDGNAVVFTASSPPAGGTHASDWVYVRDRAAGTTTEVPQLAFVDATTGGVLSRDGCHVAFWGHFFFFSPLFVFPAQWDIYTWNRCTGTAPVQVSTAAGFPTLNEAGAFRGPLAISADGRYIAYIATPGGGSSRIGRIDTNAPVTDSLLTNGVFNANTIDISDTGAFLAIGGQTTVNDRTRNAVEGWTPPCSATTGLCNLEDIAVGNGADNISELNYNPSLSADGRYVAFTSNIPDFIGAAGFTSRQVYVRDRAAGVTKLVTSLPGQPMPGDLDEPEISPDGSQVALVQAAPPAPGAKPVREVFVAHSTSGFFNSAAFDLVSYGVSGAPTSTDSGLPVGGGGGASMSSNSRYVAFASGANVELSGVPTPTGLNVWMRERPIALDITPSLDFGTVNPGTQSAPQNAIVTNTSGVSINIGAVTPPAAPFSITANGCGGALAPGATCVITIVFTPSAPGSASSSVSVTGDGLSVSASLVGTGTAPPLPTPGSLKITPGSANYGSGAVGTSFPAKTFTVSNPGQTAVPLAGTGISGTGADQFTIVTNNCGIPSLAAGASCTIDVAATVTREGSLSATVGILGSGGQSAQAILRVKGTVQLFTPTLKMNPGVVSPGEVTAAIGSGFPPNIDVELAFFGEAPFATVHTDAAGAFRYDYLLLRNGVRIGGHQVVAIDQPQFTGVRAPLLIDLATFRPSGFSSPAITSGVRSLVSRGG